MRPPCTHLKLVVIDYVIVGGCLCALNICLVDIYVHTSHNIDNTHAYLIWVHNPCGNTGVLHMKSHLWNQLCVHLLIWMQATSRLVRETQNGNINYKLISSICYVRLLLGIDYWILIEHLMITCIIRMEVMYNVHGTDIVIKQKNPLVYRLLILLLIAWNQ